MDLLPITNFRRLAYALQQLVRCAWSFLMSSLSFQIKMIFLLYLNTPGRPGTSWWQAHFCWRGPNPGTQISNASAPNSLSVCRKMIKMMLPAKLRPYKTSTWNFTLVWLWLLQESRDYNDGDNKLHISGSDIGVKPTSNLAWASFVRIAFWARLRFWDRTTWLSDGSKAASELQRPWLWARCWLHALQSRLQ